MRLCFLALFCALLVSAQARPKATIDPASPEGKLLEQLNQQQDPAQKQQLMESFAAQYPKSSAAPWIYSQLQPLYLKQQQFDKVLETGEKALAVDPDDPVSAYNNLKASEGKKDPELVKLWALRTSQNARKIVAAGKNSTPEERQELDYATQLDVYTEYSVYAMALTVPDPEKTIDLTENLEQRNPKSQYLPKVYGRYLNALRSAGQSDKAGIKAEQMAASDSSNEDVLLIAADYNLQKKSDPEKVTDYSTRLIHLLDTKPRPEGISEDDWKRKHDAFLGLGYWMAGITYSNEGRYAEADKFLRNALPFLDDPQLRGMGLFHLGLADYQLGKAGHDKSRLQDGLKFSEEAATIKSPIQTQAQKNVKAIRAELGQR